MFATKFLEKYIFPLYGQANTKRDYETSPRSHITGTARPFRHSGPKTNPLNIVMPKVFYKDGKGF